MLDLGASERLDLVEGRVDPALELAQALSARPGKDRANGDAAGQDDAVAFASAEVRRRVEAGEAPVGLYRLSEVLSSTVLPAPPEPRQPVGDPGAIVEVVRRYPCAALDASDARGVANGLAGVLADGRRVLVTGVDSARLAEVRAALPELMRGLCLDGELPLTDAELRELRSLLVTMRPRHPARLNQLLPEPELVPTVDRVAELCQAAGGEGFPPREGTDLLPELLSTLSAARLQGLVATARRCQEALSAVGQDDGYRDASWTRPLLERVVFGSAREGFDNLLRQTAEIVQAAAKLSDAADRMAVVGRLPFDAVERLNDYADYLDAGGKARARFRSVQQRAVEPTLRQLKLNDAPIKDSTLLRQAVAFIKLISAMDHVSMACAEVDVPVPSDVPGISELNHRLTRVEQALRATDALRHEVLFIHPNSPVSMPDLATTRSVAAAIVEFGSANGRRQAQLQLREITETLVRVVAEAPAERPAAPEFQRVIDALRAVSQPDYAAALTELSAARRQQADERRLSQLLDRLRESAPELARAWESGPRPFTQGTARFVVLDELLRSLPQADTADLVLLLGAGSLDRENLLVAAAAPRLLAVDAGFSETPVPDPVPGGVTRLLSSEDTVLTVLRRAGVPVLVAEVSPGSNTVAPVERSATVEAGRSGSDSGRKRPERTEPRQAAAAEPAAKPPVDRPRAERPLTEQEAAFMVLPLGIVPRQVDRRAAESADAQPHATR